MADPTLRELAQAVVDAGPTECVWPVNAPTSALLKALMPVVGDKSSPLYDTARAILAALDAADAQGYARAMGDVVEHAEAKRADADRVYGPGSTRLQRSMEDLIEWARERLPAAATGSNGAAGGYSDGRIVMGGGGAGPRTAAAEKDREG